MSNRRPTMLLISFVEWGGSFQRPHHLALGMARRGWQVCFASPGYLHRRNVRVQHLSEFPEGFEVREPAALPAASRLRPIARINEFWMQRNLQPSDGQPWDVIVFNDPRWARLASRLPARYRIFDCMDDLSTSTSHGKEAVAAEMQALSVADRVWTGTYTLRERIGEAHEAVHFIPCGVDADHFSTASPERIEALRASLPGEGPVAGYFGMINERIDVPCLQALLDSGPWRIVLLGAETSRAPQMPDHPRLIRPGLVPYSELPAWLSLFDLALIPYDFHGGHRFLYPVKALEYLAGGCPVLSTPLPDVERFLGEFVELAATPKEWGAAGKALLAPSSEVLARTAAGRDYAFSRRWETMIDEMSEDLSQLPDLIDI